MVFEEILPNLTLNSQLEAVNRQIETKRIEQNQFGFEKRNRMCDALCQQQNQERIQREIDPLLSLKAALESQISEKTEINNNENNTSLKPLILLGGLALLIL